VVDKECGELITDHEHLKKDKWAWDVCRTRNGAESWTTNKDIAKRLATFENKVLRMFGGIKVNEKLEKVI
jgi:hypothetical protein